MAEKWTADQVEEALTGAIRECNWPAVEGLLRMLAARDPDRAELVYKMLQAAVRTHPSRIGAD